MRLSPEIMWIAPVALIVGFAIGYGLRSLVSYLRRRRARNTLYVTQSGQARRMEPQQGRDWRMELEGDLSQVTMAPTADPDARNS